MIDQQIWGGKPTKSMGVINEFDNQTSKNTGVQSQILDGAVVITAQKTWPNVVRLPGLEKLPGVSMDPRLSKAKKSNPTKML